MHQKRAGTVLWGNIGHEVARHNEKSDHAIKARRASKNIMKEGIPFHVFQVNRLMIKNDHQGGDGPDILDRL